MSLDNIGRMFEHPDSPRNLAPVEPYFGGVSESEMPNQAAMAHDDKVTPPIGDYNGEESTTPTVKTESDHAEIYPHKNPGDIQQTRTATTWSEGPDSFTNNDQTYNSGGQPETDDTSPEPDESAEFSVESADVADESESPSDPSVAVGKTAVALWRTDIPTAEYDDPLSDLYGTHDETDSHDVVTVEPEYSSVVDDEPGAQDIIPAELGGGISDAMGSYWLVDASAPEAKEYPLDIDRLNHADTGEQGDHYSEAVERYHPERTSIGEVGNNREVLDYEELERAATAELVPAPHYVQNAQTAYPTYKTTHSDIQSPIHTRDEARPAWIQNLVREHGNLPLFGLIISEIRSRQAEARKNWHQDYKELTTGLPGIMSGFPGSLPFEQKRDAFFDRSRRMKAADRARKNSRRR